MPAARNSTTADPTAARVPVLNDPIFKPGTVTVRGEIHETPGNSWLRVRGPGETDHRVLVFRDAPGVDVTVEYDPEPEPEPLFVDGDMIAMDLGTVVRVRVRRGGRWYWADSGDESNVKDFHVAGAMRGNPDAYWRVDTAKPQAVSA